MPGEWCEWKGRRRGVHLGVKDQGELRAKKLLLNSFFFFLTLGISFVLRPSVEHGGELHNIPRTPLAGEVPHRRREDGSFTLQTLQDPILLLPWVCFQGGGFPNREGEIA
jgi:hypothetical protein